MKKPGDLDEWDEGEDVGQRGPQPERLNIEETPEEAARRIMRAGKPNKNDPDLLDEEDEEA